MVRPALRHSAAGHTGAPDPSPRAAHRRCIHRLHDAAAPVAELACSCGRERRRCGATTPWRTATAGRRSSRPPWPGSPPFAPPRWPLRGRPTARHRERARAGRPRSASGAGRGRWGARPGGVAAGPAPVLPRPPGRANRLPRRAGLPLADRARRLATSFGGAFAALLKRRCAGAWCGSWRRGPRPPRFRAGARCVRRHVPLAPGNVVGGAGRGGVLRRGSGGSRASRAAARGRR
jgi:hypothetical protein